MGFVLLDLDGTLLDSGPGIRASCLAMLRELGHEPDEGLEVRGLIGAPLEDVVRSVLRPFGDDRVEEAAAAYRRHYGETGFLGSVPYPGIELSLAEIERSGWRMLLATSKRTGIARQVVEHVKLAPYLDGIYGSLPTGELDCKPELLAYILAKEKLSADQGVMVGDRRHDVAGAKSVGLKSLGVLWGYGTQAELEAAGADKLVSVPANLVRTIRSLVR